MRPAGTSPARYASTTSGWSAEGMFRRAGLRVLALSNPFPETVLNSFGNASGKNALSGWAALPFCHAVRCSHSGDLMWSSSGQCTTFNGPAACILRRSVV